MIRVRKSIAIPASLLAEGKGYNGQDVQTQLLDDQEGKCYLCERKVGTDYVIEHQHSQKRYPKEIKEWTNLHLACSYCNGKKSDNYDHILHPSQVNIEEEIEQRIDLINNKGLFTPISTTAESQTTAELLDKLYNGSHGMRKVREEIFFNEALAKVNAFLNCLTSFVNDPSPENRQNVVNELSLSAECLGFKYWIIQDNPMLLQTFATHIVWNK